MIEAFTPGTFVRFNIPGGTRARIVKYVGEGFYEIVTIPDKRELIAKEDDLELLKEL